MPKGDKIHVLNRKEENCEPEIQERVSGWKQWINRRGGVINWNRNSCGRWKLKPAVVMGGRKPKHSFTRLKSSDHHGCHKGTCSGGGHQLWWGGCQTGTQNDLLEGHQPLQWPTFQWESAKCWKGRRDAQTAARLWLVRFDRLSETGITGVTEGERSLLCCRATRRSVNH